MLLWEVTKQERIFPIYLVLFNSFTVNETIQNIASFYFVDENRANRIDILGVRKLFPIILERWKLFPIMLDISGTLDAFINNIETLEALPILLELSKLFPTILVKVSKDPEISVQFACVSSMKYNPGKTN